MSHLVRIQKTSSYFQQSNSTRPLNKASFCNIDLTENCPSASQQLPMNSSPSASHLQI